MGQHQHGVKTSGQGVKRGGRWQMQGWGGGDAGDTAGTAPRAAGDTAGPAPRAVLGELTAANPCFSA